MDNVERERILREYKSISIEFVVTGYYNIILEESYPNSWKLEKVSTPPKKKNYDDLEDPVTWCRNWDIKNWGIVIARENDKLIGGIIIAWYTKDVNMLGDRKDRSVIWDIRVNPEFRGNGVGSKLFAIAMQWATDRNCTELIIETQNNNIQAINFYKKMGAQIHEINANAYPNLPNEIQVIFRKSLK